MHQATKVIVWLWRLSGVYSPSGEEPASLLHGLNIWPYSTSQTRTTALLSCPKHLRPNPRLRRASARRLRMRLSDGRVGRRTARISDLDWMTPMSYSKSSQDLKRISPQSRHLSGKSSISTNTGSRAKVGIALCDLVDPT